MRSLPNRAHITSNITLFPFAPLPISIRHSSILSDIFPSYGLYASPRCTKPSPMNICKMSRESLSGSTSSRNLSHFLHFAFGSKLYG